MSLFVSKTLLLVFVLLIAGCGGNGPEAPTDTRAATFMLDTYPTDSTTVQGVEYNQGMNIVLNWTSLGEINSLAKDAGYSNWADVRGLAFWYGSECNVYAEEPAGWYDSVRLWIVGHELMHCIGWPDHQ